MTSFKDSQEAAYRRIMRGAVRKGGFSKSERDVILALLNIWFYHRSGPRGYIHPSRELLAKKSDVSVKTVSRTLGFLRDNGVIVPESHINGGRSFATRYTVDDMALYRLCGGNMAKIIAAMTPRKRDTCPGINSQKTGTPCPTVYKSVTTAVGEAETVIPFPDVRRASDV